MYKDVNEFQKFLEKYKGFRELPEQYKSTKFCKLYMRIYNYMLNLWNSTNFKAFLKRYFNYIYSFIEAKDFYKWKYRVNILITEKISNSDYRKFESLYGSKAKEFFNESNKKRINKCKESWQNKSKEEVKEIVEKREFTCIAKYNTKNPMQFKEIQERVSNTWQNKTKEELELRNQKTLKTLEEKYGKGIINVWQVEEIKEKCKAKHIENLGVEHPMKSKEIQEKAKATNLEIYGVEYPFLLSSYSSHSKIADDMCLALDILYSTLDTNDTKYFTKNGEFSLTTKNNHSFFYDYTNIIEKWIVEFQGTYIHGLIEGQEYVYSTPVEEIHKKDEEKKILAEQNGYKVFYVYENEYKSNKSKCLENLLKEIKEYVHSQNNMI